MKNQPGRALTVFLVVIAVLMVCVSGIAVFFLFKEREVRQATQYKLEEKIVTLNNMTQDVEAAKEQLHVLTEKNKEAEERIENLMEELELESALREEAKKENRQLREEMEQLSQEYLQMEDQLKTAKASSADATAELKQQLQSAQEQIGKLEARQQELVQTNEQLKEQGSSDLDVASADDVTLERIVVNADGEKEGKVISVDRETDFVIVSLGKVDGIDKGTTLAIYRESDYLGDVTVSRVLPEMAAADFKPPLSNDAVEKGDRVRIKTN